MVNDTARKFKKTIELAIEKINDYILSVGNTSYLLKYNETTPSVDSIEISVEHSVVVVSTDPVALASLAARDGEGNEGMGTDELLQYAAIYISDILGTATIMAIIASGMNVPQKHSKAYSAMLEQKAALLEWVFTRDSAKANDMLPQKVFDIVSTSLSEVFMKEENDE